jgi:hypothetical protein
LQACAAEALTAEKANIVVPATRTHNHTKVLAPPRRRLCRGASDGHQPSVRIVVRWLAKVLMLAAQSGTLLFVNPGRRNLVINRNSDGF